jgi:hypothetical protein
VRFSVLYCHTLRRPSISVPLFQHRMYAWCMRCCFRRTMLSFRPTPTLAGARLLQALAQFAMCHRPDEVPLVPPSVPALMPPAHKPYDAARGPLGPLLLAEAAARSVDIPGPSSLCGATVLVQYPVLGLSLPAHHMLQRAGVSYLCPLAFLSSKLAVGSVFRVWACRCRVCTFDCVCTVPIILPLFAMQVTSPSPAPRLRPTSAPPPHHPPNPSPRRKRGRGKRRCLNVCSDRRPS